MTFFTYTPLQPSQIRLLHLHHGPKNAPLHASIEHVDLSAASGTFEALSYAWEDSKKMRILQTADGRVGLTASLCRALKRLRSVNVTRVLWADAVCINQKDEVEKGHQVRLMSKIYAAASKVVVYLGEEADGSGEALELLERISAINFHAKGITSFMLDEQLEGTGLPCAADAVWVALRKFWCRTWFRRLWVLQEFVCGYEVVIICGQWEKDWNVLRHAGLKSMNAGLVCRGYQFGVDGKEFQDAYAGCNAFNAMTWMRSRAQGFMSTPFILLHRDFKKMFLDGKAFEFPEDSEASEEVMTWLNRSWERKHYEGVAPGFGKWRLLHLIRMTASGKTTDERDRIYSLLGLADDTDDPVFDPDYTASLDSVLRRYTVAFIQRGQCMDLFPLTGLGSQPDGCPSWVPYLTKASSAIINQYIPFGGMNVYSAAGRSKEEVRVVEESDTLILKGSLFDQIWFIGEDTSTLMGAGQAMPFFLGFHIGYAIFLLGTLPSYPTGESMEEVLWRTLVANRTADLSEAPASYGDEFKKWIDHLFTGQEQMPYASFQDMAESLWYRAGQAYANAFLISFPRRRICITNKGYVGLAPLNTQRGDFLYVLNGGDVPYVLRPSRDRHGAMRLVGEAYIHGIMKGEAMVAKDRVETDVVIH